ncbi:UNVERIFIED_CONTAM: hypothetical protein FKN15_053879 [Acipenser sinensis]
MLQNPVLRTDFLKTVSSHHLTKPTPSFVHREELGSIIPAKVSFSIDSILTKPESERRCSPFPEPPSLKHSSLGWQSRPAAIPYPFSLGYLPYHAGLLYATEQHYQQEEVQKRCAYSYPGCFQRGLQSHSLDSVSWRAGSSKMKRVRTVFTPEQLDRLEREFLKQQYMVGTERVDLAQTLNLSETQPLPQNVKHPAFVRVCPAGLQSHSLDSVSWRAGSSKMKRVRTVFTPEQLDRLEREFLKQQYMVGTERVDLAQTLNLSETQVKVWFQNRRIKWRKQSHEKKKAKMAHLGATLPDLHLESEEVAEEEEEEDEDDMIEVV